MAQCLLERTGEHENEGTVDDRLGCAVRAKLSRVVETKADLRYGHPSGVWGRDLSRL